MKLFQLALTREQAIGVEIDRGLINFTEAFQTYNFIRKKRMMVKLGSIQELISLSDFSDDLILRVFDYLETHNLWEQFIIQDDYDIKAPILNPGKILCVGLNYIAHAAEGGQDVPDKPNFFGKVGSSVIGTDEGILLPDGVGRVDYELELAVVISKKARNINPDHFEKYVAGYTVFNDVTARDLQKAAKTAGRPWFLSKNMDTFGPMGPCLVTPRELPYPFDLDTELRLNGEVKQKSNTGNMIFKIPQLLSMISKYLTLYPGDLISTGTSEGVGGIKRGDLIEAEIEKIGILRNKVE
jgi:5-oxopent-3-ene-1,2,5-tricarboxylate decarboxylase/2-hydroxyhepta-2,4-diene-1,7-dioate isomerase